MTMSLTIVMVGFLFVDLLILFLFVLNLKKYEAKANDVIPMVSILVAAKDEEHAIARCLDSLLNLSYPQHKLEILVGNDASNDDTLEILRSYEHKHAHIKVLDITDKVGEQQGKSNVLAQLANKAQGEYYLITDADMALPKDWIQYLVSSIKDGVGMAIGVTQVQGDRLQDLDWLYALGMLKVAADLGYPMTGMGNNMIVSKEAYDSVGGYAALPFSITEDYELFKHVKEKGYQCAHVFQKEVLGTTLPIVGFRNLLNQRKRWMKGAAQLPIPMLLLLSLQPGFYIVLVFMFFISPEISLYIIGGKLLIKLFLMSSIRTKLNTPFRFVSVILYEIYALVLAIASGIYYFLPTKIVWKGREY